MFVAAAVIAAHASVSKEGFRQRDVRFLIELFTNWVEMTLGGQVLEVNNTQVQRYLDQLVAEGFARRFMRGKQPCYRLARTGLIELLNRILPQSFCAYPQHFFFLYYFITNYRPRLEKLIEEEGKQFPIALKLEVQGLLDRDALVRHQLHFADLEMKKLNERINDAAKASELFSDLTKRGLSVVEATKEVEKLYPYELNSQKPLTELISSIPEDLARWEMQVGTVQRSKHVWQPTREMLQAYIKCLKQL